MSFHLIQCRIIVRDDVFSVFVASRVCQFTTRGNSMLFGHLEALIASVICNRSFSMDMVSFESNKSVLVSDM